MNSGRLDGKVAIITGSSRGIGKAIAMELARQGASVVLNGRDENRLQAAESELRKFTNRVLSVCCDVSTVDGGQLLIAESIKAFGKLDIFVSNVGISMRGNFADLNPEVFRTIFESNILGAVYPAIPALKHLRATQGSIIFISSLAAIHGLPFLSAYCSSKMALRAIADSIRIEEFRHRVHVGIIYVGFTENDPGKEAIAADGSKIILLPRHGKDVNSKESVAKAVISSISKRKFITVLTGIGKMNYFLQRFSALLVEKIILLNIKKFESRRE